MKYKLPHAVQVGPRIFDIKYSEKVVDDDKEEVCGLCHTIKKSIEISTTENKTLEEFKETIFHETLHAIFYVSGQSYNLGSSKKEEGIVTTFENHLSTSIDWKSDIWLDWKMI